MNWLLNHLGEEFGPKPPALIPDSGFPQEAKTLARQLNLSLSNSCYEMILATAREQSVVECHRGDVEHFHGSA